MHTIGSLECKGQAYTDSRQELYQGNLPQAESDTTDTIDANFTDF